MGGGAIWAGARGGQDRTYGHSRVPWRALRARAGQGFGGTGAGGDTELVQMAGAGWARGAKCGISCGDAAAAQAFAEGAVDRADGAGGGSSERGCGELAGAGWGDSR